MVHRAQNSRSHLLRVVARFASLVDREVESRITDRFLELVLADVVDEVGVLDGPDDVDGSVLRGQEEVCVGDSGCDAASASYDEDVGEGSEV